MECGGREVVEVDRDEVSLTDPCVVGSELSVEGGAWPEVERFGGQSIVLLI